MNMRQLFKHLMALAKRLRQRGFPFEPPVDPYARVREPRPRAPGGRSTAAAEPEPREDIAVRAVGSRRV
jgi:hypothetical protein